MLETSYNSTIYLCMTFQVVVDVVARAVITVVVRVVVKVVVVTLETDTAVINVVPVGVEVLFVGCQYNVSRESWQECRGNLRGV